MPEDISQDISIKGEGNIVVGKGDVIINPLPPAEARLRHDLGILLKNVETTWIKGVLEKSVHEAALLELGMEIRNEAVDNPWRMVMERPDQSREEVPKGRKIKDTFDEANRLLLILGEPGSGKTTTLLQLARDLIAEVDQTLSQPVPVILNLSTWTNKQQPFDEWLIAELNSKYHLPKKDGKGWFRERRILPLLDGLDEVKVENRAACVERINQLIVNYGLQGFVVCSRLKDYTDLDVRLAFHRAIYIQPFTSEQVDEYLNQAGDKLASLRSTLQRDEALRSMAQSPLILNIMSLAYQDTSAQALNDPMLNTDKVRRQRLFDTYIARMFKRKVGEPEYAAEQTKQYISWLARNMRWHNQDVFLIEGLQPSWLLTRRWQLFYILVSRMIGGSSVGLGLGLGLEFELRIESFLWCTALGLIAGLFVGLVDILRSEWLSKRRKARKLPVFWWSIINSAVIGLMVGMIGWIGGPHTRLSIPRLDFALDFGLIFGLIFGLRGGRRSVEVDIETVEALHWSWREAFIGGLTGGLVGLLFGMIRIRPDRWMEVLIIGLALGLFFMLMGGILNGLRREIMETTVSPNQGIRLSIRNAMFGGMMIGLLYGLMTGLVYGLAYRRIDFGTMSFGLISFGLIGGLWYGGLDVIQHYTLRLLLIIQGYTPAHYARFLDYAVDRIFLQKVGGGYRFIHRLLLEHFADLDERES